MLLPRNAYRKRLNRKRMLGHSHDEKLGKKFDDQGGGKTARAWAIISAATTAQTEIAW
jgi:hypothetical protein